MSSRGRSAASPAGRVGARQARGRSYHHGDLSGALIETGIQLITERGVRHFSLAEASRRLGVAPSAPYAHFADRDALLAAIAVHALSLFRAELEPQIARARSDAERMAEVSRAYVRFASRHEALFRTLFEFSLDKRRHPEIAAAERPIQDVFLESVRVVSPPQPTSASNALATAVEATAHGHAALLLDGHFGRGRSAAKRAADSAARATLALIEGRAVLTNSSNAGR